MLSPFPGMDPFIEDPSYFHSVHQRLITYISELLQPLLPDPYYADIEDRIWIEEETGEKQRVPDVNVLRGDGPSRPLFASGGVAVAEPITISHPVPITVPQIEMSEWYLNIYARHDGREKIVTTIEVLSEANKTGGKHGRDLYLEKQRMVLRGDTHLVEIDFLRRGLHTTAVPVARLKRAVPSYDYHACVKRHDELENFYVYPIHLPDRLPTLAIPLLEGDGIVPLDLQKAFERAYDTGPYARRVRYTDPAPEPALSAERAAWVTQVLREKGKLPAA